MRARSSRAGGTWIGSCTTRRQARRGSPPGPRRDRTSRPRAGWTTSPPSTTAHRSEYPGGAVIVGTGYIGLELADAFIHRGLEDVTVKEMADEALTSAGQAAAGAAALQPRTHQAADPVGVEVCVHARVGEVDAGGARDRCLCHHDRRPTRRPAC